MHVTCFIKTLIIILSKMHVAYFVKTLIVILSKMHVTCFVKTLIVILFNKIDKKILLKQLGKTTT